MGTGILASQGTYDAANKTFTYTAEEEMTPGNITKVRELIKITDKDRHVFVWYEDHAARK